uniref:DUF4371 domain-containing protein n=1 Tax=Latimeria chalumnae TaxID=7897 RepID=H3A0I4_LATCH
FSGGMMRHDSSNKGNYIEILELVASTQPNLFNRLRSRYGHYTSHQYQNDLIHSAAEVLRESIVEEVRQAKYFSVLVDETKDVSKKEQLCLLLHYHRKGIIQERALGCFHIENLNAQSVSNLIIQEVQHLKFDVNYTVAQCYDAASVLSGHLTGVQTQIWEQIPHTIYVHCQAHKLNLVIADITQCQEVFTFAQEQYIFLSSSYKYYELFVKAQQDLGQRILELGRLCETHWSCRYNSLQTLHARYGTVLETLEAISLQRADGVSTITARGLSKRLKSYSFLRLLVLERIFKILNSASEELQSKDLNISSALELVTSNVTALKEVRSSESKWKELCDEPENIAKELEIAIPSQAAAIVTLGQSNMHDVPKSSQEYIKANFYSPVLDRILAESDRRFTSNSSWLSALTACNPNSESFLDYNKLNLDAELEAAKMHTAPQKLTSIFEFRNIMNELPSAYKSSLSIVDIVLSLPVPAASNERYFSVLKRVKDCLRSTMADGRLSDILLLASECE